MPNESSARALAQLRDMLTSNKEMSKRLNELEEINEALALKYDTFACDTRTQLKQRFDAIRQLMIPPDSQKRLVGFIASDDKAGKPKAAWEGA